MPDTVNEEPPLSQVDFVKKQYGFLRFKSLLFMFIYSIPAFFLTMLFVATYFGVEIQIPFIHRFYDNLSSFIILLLSVAAIACWLIFFWIQVRAHQRRASLWRDSMARYEQLVKDEAKLTTPEERRMASRKAVEEAQRAITGEIPALEDTTQISFSIPHTQTINANKASAE